MVFVMDSYNLKRKKMRQKNTRLKIGILALTFLGGFMTAHSQNVLYEENMGTPTSNTPVQLYQGWQDTSVVHVGNGTCDVRGSNASTGYGNASGGGNVMINDTLKWFQISGINTTATHPTVKLYCGLRKTASENGSNFVVEFSTDSLVWVRTPMEDTLPAGAGTSGWFRVCFPYVPSHPHLHLRFSNLAQVDYRIDDIRIIDGDEPVLETAAPPTCAPSGGTFYEPQQVFLSCETPGAAIHYTLDGTDPDTQSPVCGFSIHIDTTCTLKAMATHDSMYNSNVMTAQFVILDTNSSVELPFDISGNSDSTHTEIKILPGFRSNKLGSSYANGSAKFESKNAGNAWLTAHLDSSPGTLSFALKGMKGGTPSAYSGITFLVSESPNGIQWTTVTTLNETDISTEIFTRFEDLPLSPETRYIRWQLVSATSGNTQLNDIAISKWQEPDDPNQNDNSGIDDHSGDTPSPYPNPASTFFRWNLCDNALHIELYNESGDIVRQWHNVSGGESLNLSGIAAGYYILKATTGTGKIAKSLIIQ